MGSFGDLFLWNNNTNITIINKDMIVDMSVNTQHAPGFQLFIHFHL